MSDLQQQHLSSGNAKGVKEQATDWFERQDRSDWRGDDQAELDEWLTASPANLIAYWRVEAAWSRVERLVALRPVERGAEFGKPKRYWPMLFKSVSTAIVLGLVTTTAFNFLQKEDRQTYSTSVGGREIIKLADGSQIELNTDTVVQISTRPNERKVWLSKGEAFFQVVHNADQPFLVVAANRQITDIGTRFLVRADRDHLKVSVIQGAVSVATTDTQVKSQSLLLTAGDVVVASADVMSVKRASDRQLESALGWRRGVLVFYHTPLSEAVRELNRYNREKIVIGDARSAGQTVNGTFPSTSVRPFVEVAQSIFQLQVKKRNGEIVISQ